MNQDNLEYIINKKIYSNCTNSQNEESGNAGNKTNTTEKLRNHLTDLLRGLPNVLFLSGAGTSYKSKDTDKKNDSYPLMQDLLAKLKTDDKKYIEDKNDSTPKEILDKPQKKDNLEEILSELSTEDQKVISKAIVSILNEIENTHPNTSVHEEFVKKVSSFLYKNNRLKIFTTNYDTMFERACANINYVINDGFSFTNNTYSPLSFNYEIVKNNNDVIEYIPNMIHLYKLHGSLTWEFKKEGNETSQFISKNKTCVNNPIIIYPTKNKYENSYDLPYIDMISEFNISMQKPNTLLIICGYSFGDKHINSLIERAFNINNKLHMIIINPYARVIINNDVPTTVLEAYIQKAHQYSNISVINASFENFTKNYLPNLYILKEDNFENKVLQQKIPGKNE